MEKINSQIYNMGLVHADITGHVTFQWLDSNNPMYSKVQVHMHSDTWKKFDRPSKIAVTVECLN